MSAPVSKFALMHKEFNCPWIQPTVIVTMREAVQEAAIWIESLTEQTMSFSCTSVVSTANLNLGSLQPIFDALFLKVTQYHPK